MVARFTQGNRKGDVKQFRDFSLATHNFGKQIAEWDDVVMSVKMNCLAVTRACPTLLAGKVVPSKYRISPVNVPTGFAKDFCWFSDSTFPSWMISASSLAISFYQSEQVFFGSLVMAIQEVRNTETWTVHPFLYLDWFSASTMTKVLSLIFINPLVYTAIIGFGVISWIVLQFVTFCKAAKRCSFDVKSHVLHCIRFNGDRQEKAGELLEALPDNAEGNQQLSAANGNVLVAAKVHRLRDEDFQPISPISARRESDDIVGTYSNVGKASKLFAITEQCW